MPYDHEKQKALDKIHLLHPLPGDYWHDMCACVARVLKADKDRVLIQKLTGMQGKEISDFDPKPRVMSKKSFAKWLSYNSIPGTWAHVIPERYPPEWITQTSG